MNSRYFILVRRKMYPERSNHHLQLRVNKHHTIQDSPTSVLAYGVAKTIDVRGTYKTNFSGWGQGGIDNYIMAQYRNI
jgi:hypothetical protein